MLVTRIIKRFSQNFQQINLQAANPQSIISKDQGHFQYIPNIQSNTIYKQTQSQDKYKSTNTATVNTTLNTNPFTSTFTNVKSVYDFAKLTGELKQLKRTGWTQFPGIKEVESVADHSWRMSLFCMLFAKDKTIDFERCIKFSIIHDLAEVIAGDITPHCGISDEQKHIMEDEGIKQLLTKLEDQEIRDELYSIWRQYEDRQCPESKLVKDLDRYEMMQQAFEYEQKYPEVDLSEFFSGASRISHPIIKIWLQELLDRRADYQEQQKKEMQNN